MGDGEENKEFLGALEVLRRASEDMETNPLAFVDEFSAAPSHFVKALLALQSDASDLLSNDPRLATLSHLLFRLKSFASSCSPSSLRRHSYRREISRLAASIGSEINSWIHRESLNHLVSLLRSAPLSNDEETIRRLLALESLVSRGFDRGLQDALVQSGALPAVESALANQAASDRVRDSCAALVLALVRFNKDVFVGEVLVGPAVGCLVAMGSAAALHSLAGLIATIRSPLVDELLAKEGISKILAFLTSPDLEVRLLALDCVVAVGYVGSKDAVDAMMRAGVVKRLLEMQRTEVAVDDDRRQMSRTDLSERSALASAVGRFAVGVEVGEGLRQREKRAFKLEVLRRVREAAADEAEVATVISEILWGSTSW